MEEQQDATDVLLDAWELFVSAVDGGRYAEHAGVVTAVSGAPVPTMNGVWLRRADANVQDVAAALDEVATAGVPFCLQGRPGAAGAVGAAAEARGLKPAGDVPLRVRPGRVRPETADGELVVEQLVPEDARLHAEVVAEGFGLPVEVARALLSPRLLRAPGVRAYVGRIGDRAVVTGLGATVRDAVAVFNVATAEPFRRRGYGAAVTARAVADGLDAGASWAMLQSSAMGLGVYERLGFCTVERWSLWVSAAE